MTRRTTDPTVASIHTDATARLAVLGGRDAAPT
jgi:hypothetical protein